MAEILGFMALFVVSALIVIRSGITLSRTGDVIAETTGLGRLWVGTIFLAIATSLPELVTNISAVRLDAPKLAGGNILGANMLNIVVLATLTLLFPKAMVHPLGRDQRILGGAALLLTAAAGLFVLFPLGIGPLSGGSLFILAGYALAMVWVYRARELSSVPAEETSHSLPLRRAWALFGLATLGILVGAPLLSYSADNLSELLGVSGTFIGVLAVALVTTMPETSVTYGSLRLGAHEMAMGNVYGSCAFNVAILGIADLFYGNPIFASLDRSHLIASGGAVALMALGLVFLRLRAQRKTAAAGVLAGLILAGWVGTLFFVFRGA